MKIMVIGGYTLTLKWHRMDMMRSFIGAGAEVVALGEAPESEWDVFFENEGIRYRSYYTDRNGTNPINDMKMMCDLKRVIREESPDKVLVYHTKPNVYGPIAAAQCGISEVYAMVGGVGSVFNSEGIRASLVKALLSRGLKAGFGKTKKVFVQNQEDTDLLVSRGVLRADKVVHIDGSGVNTAYFAEQPLPGKPVFLFVGRLVRGKGVLEYLEAASRVKQRYPDAEFHLVGPFDSNATSLDIGSVQPYISAGVVAYHGEQSDVRPFLKECSVFVFPSYYGEGVPKCALEALSTGRAIIAADATGSREVVVQGQNGFLVKPRSVDDLADAMASCCEDATLRSRFGKASRRYACKRFDVRIVNSVICKAMGLDERAALKFVRDADGAGVGHLRDDWR